MATLSIPSTRSSTASWFLLLLLTIIFLSCSLSAHAKISYAEHCGSIVPEATFSRRSIDTKRSIYISEGSFSGGNNILDPAPPPSSSSSSHLPSSTSPSLPISREFFFFAKHIYQTENAELLHVTGRISFQTGSRYTGWTSSGSSRRRRRWSRMTTYVSGSTRARLHNLSGFWSKSTGKLCMVGTGSSYLLNGTNLELSAIFTLNYPKYSTISTSIIDGKVESLDAPSSPNHFDAISLLAYVSNNYSYTQTDRVREKLSGLKTPPNSLYFGTSTLSTYRFSREQFQLEYGRECFSTGCDSIPDRNSLDLFAPTMTLIRVSFKDENVHMHIGFSNTSSLDFDLDKSLVAEGYWDSEKNTMCLLACPVHKTKDHARDSYVGECTIGFSFWFPAVYTIKNMNSVMGRIWSLERISDPSYFSPVQFRSIRGGNIGVLPGVKYNYTHADSMLSNCRRNEANNLHHQGYPDGSAVEDLRFDLSLKSSSKVTIWGSATPLSLGENFYGDSIVELTSDVSFEQDNRSDATQTIWNVSYAITYSSYAPDFHEEVVYILAEGIYNSEIGKLCMVGCKYPSSPPTPSLKRFEDSLDCEIRIDMQLSPMNQLPRNNSSTGHLNGTMRSTRNERDPLYFGPLEISSYAMYSTEITEVISRMDMEIVMVVCSLTLSCIFIIFQLFHARKHRGVLSSISITMLVILTLGYMVPLLLNFNALFSTTTRSMYVVEWRGGWLEANEVIVRVMTMVAFLLQFRLLQLAWTSRFAEGSKENVWVAERKALSFCLPLYCSGALIAWFVHTRSSKYQEASHQSKWVHMTSYVGLIIDGFLLPQISFNAALELKDKALSPVFYIGGTAVRGFPHIYDTYRARNYVPYSNSSYFYANPSADYYSYVWDAIVPLQGLLFAALIYLQQRFGGRCFLPQRFRKFAGYERVPVISL